MWVEDWHAVEAAGLTYDLLVRSRELPAALAVARERPGLRFVIDHLAKPPIRSGATEPWASLMRPFGELPNVWCKLSGLVTEADPVAWRVDDLAPYVDVALETFGPARLIFGSDWPVCLRRRLVRGRGLGCPGAHRRAVEPRARRRSSAEPPNVRTACQSRRTGSDSSAASQCRSAMRAGTRSAVARTLSSVMLAAHGPSPPG